MELTTQLIERKPIERLRESITTTPGRMRLLAVLIALSAVGAGVVTATAATARKHAAHAVAAQTEPLLVEADGLYASLSDADATAATTFLTGGIEPVARRRRYVSDLRSATSELSTLSHQVGNDPVARAAVSTVVAQLPVYSGLVETARANNRQGFPIGAAYLRQASDLMRQTILPASGRLYALEARRLASDYGSGVSTGTYVAVALAGALALAVLIVSQLYVALRTRRVFNVPMLVGSLILLGVVVWTLVGFSAEQDALSRAQRKGSDSVEVLSATRILTLRAEGDESLALVARGGGDQYVADFSTVNSVLGHTGGRGLLSEAAGVSRQTGSAKSFAGFVSLLARYRNVHGRIAAFENSGEFGDAIKLAVGTRAKEAPLADRLNASLGAQIAVAQRRFRQAVGDATAALRGLSFGIPVVVAVAGVLALFGLFQRINEYR